MVTLREQVELIRPLHGYEGIGTTGGEGGGQTVGAGCRHGILRGRSPEKTGGEGLAHTGLLPSGHARQTRQQRDSDGVALHRCRR